MWGDSGPGTWLPARLERRREALEAWQSENERRWAAEALADVQNTELLRALRAADAWNGRPVSAEVREWNQHYVDLATVAPAIKTVWLRRGTHAAALVQPAMGIAIRHCTIVCPPITDVESLLTAYHELGHTRSSAWLASLDGKKAQALGAAGRSRVFHRELDAWRWARHHSPIWDDRCQHDMVQSLKGYLAHAELRDVEAVVAVETFCSYGGYANELQRRMRLEQAAEMRRL